MKEQREAFNRLLQLGEGYEAAKLALSFARRAAEAVQGAIVERIRADKEQTAERVTELSGLIADGSRPASTRRVWELELAQLKARTFGATTDERKAFDAEMTAAQDAADDLSRLQREIRETIQTANGAITELRAQTLGDPCSGLWGIGSKVTAKPFRRYAGRWAHDRTATAFPAFSHRRDPSGGVGTHERGTRPRFGAGGLFPGRAGRPGGAARADLRTLGRTVPTV